MKCEKVKKRKSRLWQRMMAVMLCAAMAAGMTDGAASNMAFAKETVSGNVAAQSADDVTETWSESVSGNTTISGGTVEDPKVIEVSGLVQVNGIITISGHVKFIGTNEGTLQWTNGFKNAIVVNEDASATFEDVTLDGNGKTFDRSALLFKGTVAFNAGTTVKSFKSEGWARAEEGNKGVIGVFEKGILNIYDGAVITGNTSVRGGIISIYQNQDAEVKVTTATLNMYGGTIEENVECTNAVVWNWFGYLNIYGGTVSAANANNVYAVQGQGSMDGFEAVTKIYGGTFEGGQNGAVCAGDDTENCQCDFAIRGGVFSGKDAITVKKYGTINIVGGKYTGTQYALRNERGGSLTVEGGEFFGESKAYYGTIDTQAKEVVVGDSDAERENWDGSTSLNTYKYVMIGKIDENGVDQSGDLDGSGTAEAPYLIHIKEDLEKFRDLVNAGNSSEDTYAQLTADIDLSGSEDSQWTPMGTEENPFTGTLTGDGHKVSGLYIDNESDNQGLIGVNAGSVENLTVEGSVTGGKNVGGIAGINAEQGRISGCTSGVTVYGKKQNMGGIAGTNEGTIENCVVKEGVTGYDGPDATWGQWIGGIAGINGSQGKVKDCIVNGHVKGYGSDGDHFSLGIYVRIGAVIGENRNENLNSDITGNYYQKDSEIGLNSNLYGIGGTDTKTDPEGITTGPDLIWIEPALADYVDNNYPYPGGYYKITTKEALEELRDNVNKGCTYKGKNFRLENNIDLGGSEENPWTPIGTEEFPFRGTFTAKNLNCEEITGLYINNSDGSSNQGLFGVNEGTIEKFTIKDAVVTGTGDNIGGVVGYNKGTIYNVWLYSGTVAGRNNVGGIAGVNDGTVNNGEYQRDSSTTGTGDNVGGFVGKNNGTIRNQCYAAGSVEGRDNVGGIAGNNTVTGVIDGRMDDESILYCKNFCNVKGKEEIGGIAGRNHGTMEYCLNMSENVTGKDKVGGIAGTNRGTGTVKNSRNNGNVIVPDDKTGDYFGAIIGYNENGSPDAFAGNYYQKRTNSKEITGIGCTVPDPEGIKGGWLSEDALDGAGSEDEPYQIANADDLQRFRSFVNEGCSFEGVYVELTDDIDLADLTWGWTSPIGYDRYDNDTFTGIFDGNGHTVKNLDFDDQGYNTVVGLFGTNEGTIKNLTVSGRVTGSSSYVGGIVGKNKGTIENCISQVMVTGGDYSYYVGGIAGYNEGTIKSCTNEGEINGYSAVGGIAGYNKGTSESAKAVLSDNKNTAPVTGSQRVGGIVGAIGPYSVVKNCINSGNVTGTGTGSAPSYTPGAIIGSNESSGNVLTDNYFQKTAGINEDISGIGDRYAGKEVEGIKHGETPDPTEAPAPTGTPDPTGTPAPTGTPDPMGTQAPTGTPDLTGTQAPTRTPDPTGTQAPTPGGSIDLTGSGTAEDPYQIGTKEDLEKLRDLVNAGNSFENTYFQLTADIDLSGSEASQWTPIGTDTDGTGGTPFAGIFDGNGHTIRGLYINDLESDNQGLFGTNAGIIKNLTVEGGVTGKDNIGGIAGTNTETGQISGCVTGVTVKGNDCVGGTAGRNDGVIENCTNKGSVTGKDSIGGITGGNGSSGTVTGCTSSGNVTGEEGADSRPGAIIGNNDNSSLENVADNYYQKTEEINNGLTGIGSGEGSGTDPAGITSGTAPAKPPAKPTDQEKAAGAKKVVEDTLAEVLADITAASGVTKDDIQKKIDKALTEAGITGVTVTVGDLTRTEATTTTEGSIRGSITITAGSATETVEINKTIAKLPGTGSIGDLTDDQKQIQTIAQALGVSAETAAKIQAVAKELGIPVETLLASESAILNVQSEGDVKGSTFGLIQAKASKVTKKSAKLKWKKVKGADGYKIYAAQCGKASKLKLVKAIQNGNKKSYTQKKLKKGTAYKYVVRAYKMIDGKEISLAVSKTIHIFTDGGKYGNAKSVIVKKAKATIKKGKNFKIKASEVKKKKPLKRHRKLMYESSNTKVATVTKKGVIKAKAKGSCTIYAYAQNGISKKIKVKVK